jgi:uncharacterized membrane protein HdeD (DUF308 family)
MAVSTETTADSWPSIVVGVLSVIFGLVAILGIVEVFSSFLADEFLMLLVGLLTVAFGFVLTANPMAGAMALVTLIGVFAIARGILPLTAAIQSPPMPAMPS